METRPPLYNPRKYTARFSQYTKIREDWWNSPLGQAQAALRDDATTKTDECIRLNAILYDLYIPESYFFYFPDNLEKKMIDQKIRQHLEQEQCENAFIFIVIANATTLSRLKFEKRVLKDDKVDITVKKDSEYTIETFLKTFCGDLKHNVETRLSTSQVNFMVKNTNHDHKKQLEAFFKFIYQLGEATLNKLRQMERSFFSDTCHGIRADIVKVLKESLLKEEFEAIIIKKKAKLKKMKDKIGDLSASSLREEANLELITDMKAKAQKIEDIEEKKKNSNTTKEQYLEKLFKLCLLGDSDSIIEMKNTGFFEKLDFPPKPNQTPTTGETSSSLEGSVNPAKPFIFHNNYDEFLHKKNCQELANKITNVDDPFREHITNYEDFNAAAVKFPHTVYKPKIGHLADHVPKVVAKSFDVMTGLVTGSLDVVNGSFNYLLKHSGFYKQPSNNPLSTTTNEEIISSLKLTNNNNN